jgi:hypothetical protein
MAAPAQPATPSWRIAVCVVGEARGFAAACVHGSIHEHVVRALPGAVTTFSCLSQTVVGVRPGGVPDATGVKRTMLPPSSRAAVAVAARAIGASFHWDETAELDLIPKCVQPNLSTPLLQSSAYGGQVLQWARVRSCYARVVAHEASHGRFDYIMRVRPDAIFFAAWPINLAEELSAAAQAGAALIPLGGLGGNCYRACANDHMAIVPRAAAAAYFEGVYALYANCSEGPQFFGELSRRDGTMRSRHAAPAGSETRFGPGYVYSALGLRTRSVPWPYALGSRVCTATTAGRAPSSSPLDHCVQPLQCGRLKALLSPTLHVEPWRASLEALVQSCEQWSCAAATAGMASRAETPKAAGGIHIPDHPRRRPRPPAPAPAPPAFAQPRRKMALVTKCSGMNRATFKGWAKVQDARAAARESDKMKHSSACGDALVNLSALSPTGGTEWERKAKMDWQRSGKPHYPEYCGPSRSFMCLSSICSVINATQSSEADVVAMVDRETPPDVVDAYHRLGVRVLAFSESFFPPYFNRAPTVLREELPSLRQARYFAPRDNKYPTVGEAVAAGHPHHSYIPDSWYKLALWNLTDYSKVLYFDPDTLTVRDTVKALLNKYPDDAITAYFDTKMHAVPTKYAPPGYFNAGLMIVAPKLDIYEQLMRIWRGGHYPYIVPDRHVGVSPAGDDDQWFLLNALAQKGKYSGGLSKGGVSGPGTGLKKIHICDVAKAGNPHCDVDRMSLLHKVPLWEVSRQHALYRAAVEGRCRDNPSLLAWNPASQMNERRRQADVKRTGVVTK